MGGPSRHVADSYMDYRERQKGILLAGVAVYYVSKQFAIIGTCLI